MEGKTRLSQLSADCMQTSLEHVRVNPLVNLADANEEYFPVVEKILQKTLAEKPVVLINPYYNGHGKNNFWRPDGIVITYIPLMKKLLTRFGSLISSLGLHGFFLDEFDLINDKAICGLVNEHCTETLTQLNITNSEDDIFAEFQKPFAKVESVLLMEISDLHRTNIRLNKIFPSIRHLNVKSVDDGVFNDLKMPNLEELSFTPHERNDPKLFEGLITSNPQIRRLNLTSVSPDSLRVVVDNMPNLEFFGFESYEGVNEFDSNEQRIKGAEKFHFEQLKTLSVVNKHSLFLPVITFAKLEELTFGSHYDGDQFFSFVLDNKNTLKKAYSRSSLDHTQILALANANLNLVELKFACVSFCTKREVQSVIQLIEKSKNLNQLRFLVERTDTEFRVYYRTLNKRFGGQWNVDLDYGDNSILLERKSTNGNVAGDGGESTV